MFGDDEEDPLTALLAAAEEDEPLSGGARGSNDPDPGHMQIERVPKPQDETAYADVDPGTRWDEEFGDTRPSLPPVIPAKKKDESLTATKSGKLQKQKTGGVK